MWFSTFLISILGSIVINKFLAPKIVKKYEYEEEELVIDKDAHKLSLIAFLISLIIVIYFILPIDIPFAGLLLDKSQVRYIDMLLGESSPFGNGFVVIISIILIIIFYSHTKSCIVSIFYFT